MNLLACSESKDSGEAEEQTIEDSAEPTSEPAEEASSEPAQEPAEEPSAEPAEESTEPLELSAGINEMSIAQEIDGVMVDRPVFIHTPPLFDANANYPVLFAFHGNASNSPTPVAETNIVKYEALVNSGAFIGVYPQGHLNSWNLGQELSTADDIDYVTQIVGLISEANGVNEERIYATGFSNGAGLTQHLAVNTTLFKAVAPVSTALVVNNEPTNSTPTLSVLQIHGIDDMTCPYLGGAQNVTGHDFYSSEESAALWAAHNGCDETPLVTTTSSGNEHYDYQNCSNGVKVVQLSLPNVEHNVPSDTEGNLNQFIWGFLNAH